MDTAEVLVEVDERGRAALGRVASPGRYLAHVEPDGTVLLEPAVIVTRTQQWFIESGEAAKADQALANPDELVTATRRTRRGNASVA